MKQNFNSLYSHNNLSSLSTLLQRQFVPVVKAILASILHYYTLI